MTTRMLIDARHREETRVAVVKGNRIEEFDFESAERKQLKGNIYLAKVTRVSSRWRASISIRVVIEWSPRAPRDYGRRATMCAPMRRADGRRRCVCSQVRPGGTP
ncbi:MAG: hypothetical protein EOP67_52780 [Sphingomonas sp.]|nr:MAG: hypothetical protein EOP67_52780 [Sphingomonas sp.]